MGIYYTTYFYPDIQDKSKFTILAHMNPVLDDSDIKRGYVAKEELLRHYSHLIELIEITEHSYIIEYTISTMMPGQPHLHESRRFPIY